MAFKDTWKNKVDGIDDVVADDINSIAQEAIRLDSDKVDKVSGKQLSTNDFTNAYKKNVDDNTQARHTHNNKQLLDSITQERVNKWDNETGGSGSVTVDQTFDPESENAQSGKAVAEALDTKVDKKEGKGLSTNDFTNEEKEKLAGLNNYDDTNIKTEISENTKSRHTHSNKSVLDRITSKDIFNWNNGTEIQVRKYYDEPFDKISDVSLFEFTLDDEKMTATAQIKYDKIIEQGITELVIPYEYIDDNKTYLVTNITRYDDEVGVAPSVKKIIIPNTIINIGDGAFMGCSNVTGVHIPNSVMSIDSRAFLRTGLTNIIIPRGVTNIGSYAFAFCSNLTNVDIPESVAYMSLSVFFECRSLTKVIIPYGVTNIPYSTFENCSSLRDVVISDSVTSIERNAFSKCTGIRDITIPNSVINIEPYVFNGCNELTVQCYKNSVAEEYCIANDIPYELLDIDIVTDTAEPIDDVITLTLKSQQELRLGNLTGNYALSLPLAIPKVYESYWTFTAGEGLSLRYSDLPILWRGDDCGSDGYFEPVAGRMYEVILKKINDKTLEDGTIEPVIVARVGAV